MYIDPMTLFILGEVLVVYIIINVFLFYKSRLYKVLVAVLKEMRFERLRREQLKKASLAAERAGNRGLLKKVENAEQKEAVAEVVDLPNQLSDRVAELTQQNPTAKDLLNSVEHDQSVQWLRIRMLELEQELLAGNITEQRWQELATDAIDRLTAQQASEQQAAEERKDSAEQERYTGQLESDLAESENKLNDALVRVQKLETELEELNSINTPSENPLETPRSGLHEEEIYRLKCENFDLTESINKLKLELQKADPSAGNDAYLKLLETQLNNMEQYIKSADIQTGLLEKELSSAQSTIDELTKKLAALGSNSNTVDLSPLTQLNEQHSAKTAMLDAFRDTVERLKDGESTELISSQMEEQIAQLENIIRESQQCIAILESELELSTQAMAALEKDLNNNKNELIDAKLEQLNNTQQSQKAGISSIKDLITDIREGGDTDMLLSQQEQEIEKLERFLSESEALISQLEAEIEQLQAQLEQAQETSDDSRPDSNENMEEMEELLQQFIADIQSLLRMINRLEDENETLRANSGAPPRAADNKATSGQDSESAN